MRKRKILLAAGAFLTLAAGVFIYYSYSTSSSFSDFNNEPYIAASTMPEDGLNFLIEAKNPGAIKEAEAPPAEPPEPPETSGYFLPRDFPEELFFLEETEKGSGWAGEIKTGGSNFSGAEPYPESLENNSGAIQKLTYPAQKGTTFLNLSKAGQLRNNTDLDMNRVKAMVQEPPDFSLLHPSRQEGPQVLIMHTHTTESYEPYARDFYDGSFSSRTTDPTKNMVMVGDAIAQELEAAGVGVIHDSTVHDYPSYNGSYDRSAVTVANLLMKYPTIKIVLDVHRDAIQREDGVRVAPTVEVAGKEAAQVMIIAGCDDGDMGMPNYEKNLAFGALLEQQLEATYPGLTRPLLFTYKRYNQHLTTGSLLVEVGGHANSLDQAAYSGQLIGKALSKLFLG